MQELIDRLRMLLEGIGTREHVRAGLIESSSLTSRDMARIRGMHDLLLAMESRVGTLKYRTVYPNECSWPSIEYLLEKA